MRVREKDRRRDMDKSYCSVGVLKFDQGLQRLKVSMRGARHSRGGAKYRYDARRQALAAEQLVHFVA